jgi:hypothetical protein
MSRLSLHAEKKELRSMSIREMKKKIQAHWKQFIKEEDKVDDVFYGEKAPKEKSKSSWTNNKKRFKGTCNKCGKQGHKSANCRSESKGSDGGNSNKNKDVTCYKCQQKGHYAGSCKNERKEKGDKEEFSLFCGMICQEIFEEEEEDNTVEWIFSGLAAEIENETESVESDDDESTTGSMPSLLKREFSNGDSDSDDDYVCRFGHRPRRNEFWA